MNFVDLKITKFFVLSVFILIGAGCSSDGKSEKQQASNNTENAATTNTENAATTSNTNTASTTEAVQQDKNIGIGPFKTVDLGTDINTALAEQGKTLFEGRCTACHKFEERFIGPPLNGVTERRNPVWIMNMIINPSEMLEKDPIAKELLAEYQTPMVNMGVNEDDTRAILEYLRAHDQGKVK